MGKATDAALADKGYEVVMLCNLGSYSSIGLLANLYTKEHQNLDLLVNNAGFISLDRQVKDEGSRRR